MESEEQSFNFTAPDGLRLSGVRWGEGGDRIVFTPGNGFPVHCYRPALRDLSRRVEIHALNPRGLGGSDVPHELPGWEPLLGDLRAFIEARLEPPVVMAGHSLGAMLSLWLAARAPALVKGLILLDPLVPYELNTTPPVGGSQRDRDLIARTRNRRERWPSKAEAADALRGRGVYEGWQEQAFQLFTAEGLLEEPGGEVRLACPPWLEARIYGSMPANAVWDWARNAKAPTVLLRGEDTDVATPRALEQLAEMLPMAAVFSVKGGHAFAQQYPEKTAQALVSAWELLARCMADEEVSL
ncbi:MAG: alpha/beta hydrolase [SAR324 cluster bacterium]|nr:alpha/beta hydrolase [SAR324 cluster bacterium]